MSKEAMRLSAIFTLAEKIYKEKKVIPWTEAIAEALAEQPAPLTDTELINRGCHYQTELTQPAQQQEPVDSTQISKAWWDGEKLMAKPIPFVEFYKPAQRKPLTSEEVSDLRIKHGITSHGRGIKEFTQIVDFVRDIEAAHGITENT